MKRNIFLFAMLAFCLVSSAFAQETSVPAVDSRGYLVGPGDEISGRVLGEKDFDFEATINENGLLEIPFFEEPIVAMCKNERELKEEIGNVLKKYLRNPRLSLKVGRKSRPPVSIFGEVRTPGQITLMRKARLLELLSVSGDTTESAGGMVQIFRPRPPMCGTEEEIREWQAQSNDVAGMPSQLYSLSNIKLGREEANPIIYPGDIIIVQRAAPVYFTGEVKGGSGGVYIREGGLSLQTALGMIGGVNREAKTKDIKIYRRKSDSHEREIIAVNYDKIKKGEQKDVMLEPYDIVEVDKAKENIGQILLKTVTGAATGGLGQIVTGGASRLILY